MRKLIWSTKSISLTNVLFVIAIVVATVGINLTPKTTSIFLSVTTEEIIDNTIPNTMATFQFADGTPILYANRVEVTYA